MPVICFSAADTNTCSTSRTFSEALTGQLPRPPRAQSTSNSSCPKMRATSRNRVGVSSFAVHVASRARVNTSTSTASDFRRASARSGPCPGGRGGELRVAISARVVCRTRTGIPTARYARVRNHCSAIRIGGNIGASPANAKASSSGHCGVIVSISLASTCSPTKGRLFSVSRISFPRRSWRRKASPGTPHRSGKPAASRQRPRARKPGCRRSPCSQTCYPRPRS